MSTTTWHYHTSPMLWEMFYLYYPMPWMKMSTSPFCEFKSIYWWASALRKAFSIQNGLIFQAANRLKHFQSHQTFSLSALQDNVPIPYTQLVSSRYFRTEGKHHRLHQVLFVLPSAPIPFLVGLQTARALALSTELYLHLWPSLISTVIGFIRILIHFCTSPEHRRVHNTIECSSSYPFDFLPPARTTRTYRRVPTTTLARSGRKCRNKAHYGASPCFAVFMQWLSHRTGFLGGKGEVRTICFPP